MPEQVRQTDRPELGFVSLGQYLGANKDALDQQFGKDSTDAQQFTGYDSLYNAARNMATHSGQEPQGSAVEGYQSALDSANKAQEMGRAFQGEAGLAGSGRYGASFSPDSAFNASLLWASHGPQYQQLSNYLGNYGPNAVLDAVQRGGAAGQQDYFTITHPNRTRTKPTPTTAPVGPRGSDPFIPGRGSPFKVGGG